MESKRTRPWQNFGRTAQRNGEIPCVMTRRNGTIPTRSIDGVKTDKLAIRKSAGQCRGALKGHWRIVDLRSRSPGPPSGMLRDGHAHPLTARRPGSSMNDAVAGFLMRLPFSCAFK